MNIEKIHQDIKDCKNCHLYKYMPTDSKPVPGNGDPNSDLMFIGEALGEDESITQIPFCGLCGQLFNKILKAAGINRENCYVSNIVHCRPTVDNKGFKNRPPTDEEIKACKKWIWKEIKTVNPSIIITLGKVPTYTLLNGQLNKTFSILKIMGQEYKVSYHQAKIIPVVHPSYLLQHGKSQIETVTEIFKKIKNSLGPSDHDNWANMLPKDKPHKNKK